MKTAHSIDYPAYAFWCFLISVVLLPIGLGGDRPVPIGFTQYGLSLSCLFLALSPDVWRGLYFPLRLRIAGALLAIIVLWAFIQTQPIVPQSWTHPLWQMSAAVLKIPLHGSISIVPQESLNGLTRLLTYLASGFIAYVLGQNARRARQIVVGIWSVGAAICVYGLVNMMFGNQWILWFHKWAYPDDVTATFVNRNHFAIYAGLVMSCGAALLSQAWRDGVMRAKKTYKIEAWRDWLTRRALPWGFLIILIMICICFSDSRAGLILSLIGLAAYFFFYAIYLHAFWRAGLICVLGFIVLGAVAFVAFSTSGHFAALFTDYSSQSRMQVYGLAWRAVLDNPWLGYGLNGFEPEYRLYHQLMINEFLHAHNDILECLLDLGIPVGLMMWTAVGLMLSGLWNGIRTRRQNGFFATLALAASVMVLGHALVDFDLQIPGVAVTWAALLGVGLAQSWNTAAKEADVG